MVKNIKLRRVLIVTGAILAAVAVIISMPYKFGHIASGLENPNAILAIQVTESSDLQSPFIAYYTQEPEYIEEFCSVLCDMRVKIKGLNLAAPTVRYSEKMYDARIWVGEGPAKKIIFTDEGGVYYEQAAFSLDKKEDVERITALFSKWTTDTLPTAN